MPTCRVNERHRLLRYAEWKGQGAGWAAIQAKVWQTNQLAGSAHRTQIQGPASGLLWLEVERMDTCVSPLWSELSHELTVKLLPDAWLPNQTLRQGKAEKS